ncbi:TlpA family protein disulfide reductase [Flavobacterium sp.]|uniref:TlpA family protein disulfide reductase n=1 Tax=Flavobacterium sp. TaxID=239 RepID=UPI002FDDD374
MKRIFSFVLTVLVSGLALAQESMSFQAAITNKNGEILFIKNGRQIIQEIKADDKGNFKATFPITAGMYQLFDGAEYAQLYLKNGYDLKMTMDASKFDETIAFTGKGAAENNFLAKKVLDDGKVDFMRMLSKDAEGFKKAMEEFKTTQNASLDTAKIDPDLIALLRKGTETSVAQLEQYYVMSQSKKKLNNTKAPNFDYENFKGGKTTLESLKGKYVYIDIWATWCGPCIGEIPSLKKMEAAYHGKNIEFVSISVDAEKDHEKWKNFVTKKELTGIQLFAGTTPVSEFIKTFNVDSIPRFILIDPNGVVIDADTARPSEPRLQQLFDSLLK